MENLHSKKPKPTGQVLESVGYGTSSEYPRRIVQSEGFKAALAEFGLTEELITTSLVQDIKAKPAARVKELGLGADILGMRKHEEEPEKQKNNTYNFFFNPLFQQTIKTYEDTLKQQILNAQKIKTTQETVESDEERREVS